MKIIGYRPRLEQAVVQFTTGGLTFYIRRFAKLFDDVLFGTGCCAAVPDSRRSHRRRPL